MAINTVQLQPDPNRWYSPQEILDKNFFPWIDNSNLKASDTMIRWIKKDLEQGEKSILKATVIGKGAATRYSIKGERIIDFIAKFEEGGILY